MTAKELIDRCRKGGYACMRQVKEYIKNHEKTEYTEEDVESIFRLYQPRYWTDEKYTGMAFGGKTTKHYKDWND